ncbi:alpha-L-fucosidase [Terriglobus albidus]|uniref:alpha-L-fucosidase n=1 Tax=Terriglobus albidus TaxID=1592106 RepID=UPI0021DF8470|nr:alpha-L-fucosidase [Terriglobus albidus]
MREVRPLRQIIHILSLLFLILVSFPLAGIAEDDPEKGSLNKPDRLEWFRDQGFGLFIHWSVDSQLGVVISHSLVGASPEYTDRFFNELPKTFDPDRFEPKDWARLAHLAGIRYMMFTTKHHSGFTMFDSKTTVFGVMHTPFHRDITREVFDAFRSEGISTGVYFSPDDFWWLHQNGKIIRRSVPDVQPRNNPGLMQYDQGQVKELLTNYGKVDELFLDGEAVGLRDLAWKLDPNIIVTRGAIKTPELTVPGMPLPGAWETCMTMGTAWQYQPQNEHYKSGGELIRLLVQTRAKGGNFLLNVGPKPNGELPIEEEERLREIGLWMFVNSDAIYSVRPWVITNEGDIWFTKKKDGSALYAVVESNAPWPRATWKEFTLHSVRATEKTEASVLGQNDEVVEYHPEITPKSTWHQEKDGLHVRVLQAQRLQDNFRWPNPAVIKITNVEPALKPPQVQTTGSVVGTSGEETLEGSVLDMGDQPSLEVTFEYRPVSGEDVNSRTAVWTATPAQTISRPGPFTANLNGLDPKGIYEFRAVIHHPLLPLYGTELKMKR